MQLSYEYISLNPWTKTPTHSHIEQPIMLKLFFTIIDTISNMKVSPVQKSIYLWTLFNCFSFLSSSSALQHIFGMLTFGHLRVHMILDLINIYSDSVFCWQTHLAKTNLNCYYCIEQLTSIICVLFLFQCTLLYSTIRATYVLNAIHIGGLSI